MRNYHRNIAKGLNAIMAELAEENEDYQEATLQYDRALLMATDELDKAYYRQKRDDCFKLANALVY